MLGAFSCVVQGLDYQQLLTFDVLRMDETPSTSILVHLTRKIATTSSKPLRSIKVSFSLEV